MKTAIAWIIVILLVIGGVWYYLETRDEVVPMEPQVEETAATESGTTVVGSWRSTEDPNFTREFSANGTITDRYEGIEEATTTGTWEVVAASSLSTLGLPEIEGTVIRVQFPEEAFYFSVNAETDEDTLSLTYIGGNGVLVFERI